MLQCFGMSFNLIDWWDRIPKIMTNVILLVDLILFVVLQKNRVSVILMSC